MSSIRESLGYVVCILSEPASEIRGFIKQSVMSDDFIVVADISLASRFADKQRALQVAIAAEDIVGKGVLRVAKATSVFEFEDED